MGTLTTPLTFSPLSARSSRFEQLLEDLREAHRQELKASGDALRVCGCVYGEITPGTPESPQRSMPVLHHIPRPLERLHTHAVDRLHSPYSPGTQPTPKSRALKWTKGAVFSDAKEMKDKVRANSLIENLSKETSAMHALSLKDSGFWAKLFKYKHFETVTLVVIVLNAIWMSVDTDHNEATVLAEADWPFQVAENFFCAFFTFELAVRFMALKRKTGAFRDAWFRFDFALVGLMITETWIMSLVVVVATEANGIGLEKVTILRLLRLVRLTRLTRLMRAVPELLFMLKGLLEATRSVACTLSLLLAILYVFGIIMRQLSEGTNMGKTYFHSVPAAMYTLLLNGTFLDSVRQTMDDIARESVLCAIVFLMNIVLAALTMTNMLVGVLCEVVSAVAATEKEGLAVNFVTSKVKTVLKQLDFNRDGLISKEEFQCILEHEEAVTALEAIGVDVLALVDFADFLFQSDRRGQAFDKEFDFVEFMELVLKLRGDQGATVRDIVDLRKFIHSENTARSLEIAQMLENQTILEQNQKGILKWLGARSRDLELS